MGHNLVSWKVLEEMMLELKNSGVIIPVKVVEDLRAAKSMIHLIYTDGGHSDTLKKTEEYLANVESFVITEGQNLYGADEADKWLRRLEDANIESLEKSTSPDKYIVGVPRDQRWVRIEPTGEVTAETVLLVAKDHCMQARMQSDGKIVVCGQPENLKAFVKKIATLNPRR
ncbi:MAG: DUF2096 family protein [Crenarchaeota archaeon]|nr:DUF2096 family protein [Thermoproteota archaeon]